MTAISALSGASRSKVQNLLPIAINVTRQGESLDFNNNYTGYTVILKEIPVKSGSLFFTADCKQCNLICRLGAIVPGVDLSAYHD